MNFENKIRRVIGGKCERAAQLVGGKGKREDRKGRREVDTEDISEKMAAVAVDF